MTRDSKSTIIEFPFRIACDLDEFEVASDLHVRRLDEASKARLLRIEDATYDERGRLLKFTSLPDCLFNGSLTPEIDVYDEFCSSNYALVAPNHERAVDFNFALKLAGASLSSLFIGYKKNGAVNFINPPCYFGSDVLLVGAPEIDELRRLVANSVRRHTDSKLAIMSEMYLYSMSRELRKESRFIEVSIILEMLILPTSSAELSYRFALRLARLLASKFNADLREAFALGKRIYATRSRLVHSGQDNTLDTVAPATYEAARILLAAYVNDRNLFNEEALDAICLGA